MDLGGAKSWEYDTESRKRELIEISIKPKKTNPRATTRRLKDTPHRAISIKMEATVPNGLIVLKSFLTTRAPDIKKQ